MIKEYIKKVFDIREGEFKVSLWMLSYIFLVITVLLIMKPTVHALFLANLGVKQLPFAFLLVAVTAIICSYFYAQAILKFALNSIIKTTLISSVGILICLGILLNLGFTHEIIIYFFYTWVAIYAVLSASQFWVLANLIYTIREAKRLFGFIGSGAILGGILGGYLTSFLAPIIGNENLVFLAALLLLGCVPLLQNIWREKVTTGGHCQKPDKKQATDKTSLQQILDSKHLSYIAGIVAISVLVAKLADYLFSDFAAATFLDADDLTSFFAFWFSTFNVVSLAIQLFFTRKIVGIWGVGFSLLLLPIGVLGGSLFFILLPSLSAILVIKGMDGILKQSIHKSATELIALPLPFELKKRTKSFIDVVVDSIATGLAGCLLIFVVRGLALPSIYIALLIVLLVLVWLFFIFKLRREYYKTFRSNLELLTSKKVKIKKPVEKPIAAVAGMHRIFEQGNEDQILFMLRKLMEINDPRFLADVENLLVHTSIKVKIAAIKNLYFLNSATMTVHVDALLAIEYYDLTVATLAYVLQFAEKDRQHIFDYYLADKNDRIADAALYCLAQEARENVALQKKYYLEKRLELQIAATDKPNPTIEQITKIAGIIGEANLPSFYSVLMRYAQYPETTFKTVALRAMGKTQNVLFIDTILPYLANKLTRATALDILLQYGTATTSLLLKSILNRDHSLIILRYIPAVIAKFQNQEAVKCLLHLIRDTDVTIRIEAVRALSNLRNTHPNLVFNKLRVVTTIFEECTLHHQTLAAMHTQIIISFRNRKKSKKEISDEERNARASLLNLLERRLDAGLERIFKLLGLRYQSKDIALAYEGLLSNHLEAQTNAIEFLDNLLSADLKRKLLPIIEDSTMDVSSEVVLQKMQQKILTEFACFDLLLKEHDARVKLAVLFLIKQQRDIAYRNMVTTCLKDADLRVQHFAKEALAAL